MGLFDKLGGALQGAVESAGGPMGLLLNPMAQKEIVANVRGAIEELPPSSVVLGAVTRVIASAIAMEMQKRTPSESFEATCAEFNVTGDDVSKLHRALWEEIALA